MDISRPVAFFLSLFLFMSGPAAADVLLVDSIQSAPALQTPRAGTGMTSVRQGYGDPLTEYPTVSTAGVPQQPPITRWDYNGFSVFFEHDRVIHSVVHRAAGN